MTIVACLYLLMILLKKRKLIHRTSSPQDDLKLTSHDALRLNLPQLQAKIQAPKLCTPHFECSPLASRERALLVVEDLPTANDM